MISDLPKFVRFCTRYGITAHEFMLPYMLYLDERVEIGGIVKYPNDPSEGTAIANLYKYVQSTRKWTAEEMQNLENKGLIENRNPVIRDKDYERKASNPDLMAVTDLFCEEIFAPETRWDEFVQAYPSRVPNFNNPNGPDINLQTVAEPGAWEALENFYRKIVRTKVLHDQIIDLIRWAERHGYINMNISKFVASKHWEVLMEMRREKNEPSMRLDLKQS